MQLQDILDASADDPALDDLFDMVNLPKSDTGIDGILYISTVVASHAPRVKWYPGRPHRDAPCLSVTISEPPEAHNLRLPRPVADQMAPLVSRWVTLNRAALLSFWSDGTSWTRQEVARHLDDLKKLG